MKLRSEIDNVQQHIDNVSGLLNDVQSQLESSDNHILQEMDSQIADVHTDMATQAQTIHNRIDLEVTDINERIHNEKNSLSARIDTIVTNGTASEGNTELIDIRTDYKGRVYQTAGTSVREQVQALDTTLSAIQEKIGGNHSANLYWESGGIDNDGNTQASETRLRTSHYIALPQKTAFLLFANYLDAATEIAESCGGGGSPESNWGRKDDEDDIEWARHCARQARQMHQRPIRRSRGM